MGHGARPEQVIEVCQDVREALSPAVQAPSRSTRIFATRPASREKVVRTLLPSMTQEVASQLASVRRDRTTYRCCRESAFPHGVAGLKQPATAGHES